MEVLENINVLIGTIITVLGAASYFINSLLKKKQMLKSLGIKRKDVDKQTYKYITSKEYRKCMNYAFDEETCNFEFYAPLEEDDQEVIDNG